jgi:hypothetical protein
VSDLIIIHWWIYINMYHWVYGLLSSSRIINNWKTQHLGNWICFHLQATGGGDTYSVGSLSKSWLASLALCTFNNWKKQFFHLLKMVWESASRSPFSFITSLLIGWQPLLNSFIPLYTSLIFLFFASSLILSIYSFLLIQECLLASHLILLRLSSGLWSDNSEHHSLNHSSCFFNSQ